jgi:hypothetical protein
MAGFRRRTVTTPRRGFRGFSAIQNAADAVAFIAGPGMQQAMRRAGRVVGLELENILKQSPGRPSYPLRWASVRQRKWYFAMRRAKGLDPKYRRISDPMSQKLEQRWVTKSTPTETIVGNPAEYGPYVQSSEFQSEMHADTGWTTDEQAYQKLERNGVVGRIVTQAIHDMVKRTLRGLE